MKLKILAAIIALSTAMFTIGGCAESNREEVYSGEVIEEETEEKPIETPIEEPPAVIPAIQPKTQTVKYIRVTGDSVNIRSGAGSGYSARGVAEKNTLYANSGKTGEWYKTIYKDKVSYISAKFCEEVEFDKSSDEIESIISCGARFMGVKYVYGAVRLHDGKGNMNRSFTTSAFDCSSLMQYIFYEGADKLLNVNTRTQIYQGTTIPKKNIKRGDLLFFTNDSRRYNKGIERVGHVGLYLGNNYMLHTASDYAKIEEISEKRWSYFIQSQRI